MRQIKHPIRSVGCFAFGSFFSPLPPRCCSVCLNFLQVLVFFLPVSLLLHLQSCPIVKWAAFLGRIIIISFVRLISLRTIYTHTQRENWYVYDKHVYGFTSRVLPEKGGYDFCGQPSVSSTTRSRAQHECSSTPTQWATPDQPSEWVFNFPASTPYTQPNSRVESVSVICPATDSASDRHMQGKGKETTPGKRGRNSCTL